MARAFLLVLVSTLAVACGGGGASWLTAIGGASGNGAVRGVVSYEARSPTVRGASARLEVRPARLVELEVRGAGGEVLASARTDREGRFEASLPEGAESLAALSRVRAEGHDLEVTRDRAGLQTHELSVPLRPGGGPLELVARDEADGGPAGAFHILDTVLRGVETVEGWTGRRLPAVFVWWGRGVTRSWSYYRGEQPPGSGRFALELLGGQPGRQHSTDTDEHDAAIVLHELGHLVMDRLSTDSSFGGMHPPGVLVDPGLAWEEGRVTWLATAILGDPLYRDTIGVEPLGKLRVDRDLEAVNDGPTGHGSEQTVAEVLWDLADGADGLPDLDNDGVALGARAVLQAMIALAEVEGAYPSLPSFLRFLVETGRVAEDALKQMLARGCQPPDLLPGEGAAGWPEPLSLPGRATGRIDGLSDPAPSGGPAHPSTGLDATRAYRLHVPAPARVTLRLAISGSGRAADRTDLDLELRDIRARPLATSATESAVEGITRDLAAGHYVVYVRDGGSGNLADYELTASAEVTRR